MLAAVWRNPIDSLDVDQNQFVVPLDALLVINELNSVGSHALAVVKDPALAFLDANGDQFVSPVDALLVINYLNGGGAQQRRLQEGDTLARETDVTIGLGQAAGARTYQVRIDASFDRTDPAHAIDDLLAVYLVDPQQPSETLLHSGTSGAPLFTLAESRFEAAPGVARWDGSVLTLDLSGVADRDTGLLRFQLLGHDTDRATRVTIVPLANEVDATGTATTWWPAEGAAHAAGPAANLSAFTPLADAELDFLAVRFDASTGKYAAELRLRRAAGVDGANVVVTFPNLPVGVTLRNPSGTTGAGAPYVNLRPALPPGGLARQQWSEPLLVEFDDPSQQLFPLQPTVLASANRAPVFAPVAPLDVLPGGVVRTTLQATDADGDRLSFALGAAASLPTGRLTPDGQLEFRPRPDELGTYVFDVVVSDGDLEATRSVTVRVNPDAVTTTRVSGQVLRVDGAPLAGIGVQIGAVQGLTGADGSFRLDLGSGPPVGDTLKIRGELFAGPTTYPFIAEKLPLVLEHELYEHVDNVIPRPIYLPGLDVAGGTPINPAQNTTVAPAAIPGASLFVAAGTLMNQQSTPFTGTLSITEVPPALTPLALPDGLRPDQVVTIQPGEMVFAAPAPLTLPNRSGWAPGTTFDLWSINPVTGAFEDVGDGRVDATGTKIETISGGVRTSSWHFFVAPPSPVKVKSKKACHDCTKEAPATSQVDLFTGELTETHDAPTYESLGQTRGVRLVYQSGRADARPILQAVYEQVDTGLLNNAADLRLALRATIAVNDFQLVVPGGSSPAEGGADEGLNYWSVPAGSGPLAAALQADLRRFPSGVYPYELEAGFRSLAPGAPAGSSSTSTGRIALVNEVHSPFGAGWGLVGLRRIVVGPDGSALVIDGDGSELLFTALAGGAFQSPPGDFSTLERLGDQTFRLTELDRTTWRFDAANRLVSVTDRSGNATTYQYDGSGRLAKLVDPVGLETTFTFAGDRIATIVDPAGRTLALQYDSQGNLTRITDPDGSERRFGYDEAHHLREEIDRLGRRETDEYDRFGQVVAATLADGSTLRFSAGQSQGLFPSERTADAASAPPASRTLGDGYYVDAAGFATRTALDVAGQEIFSLDAGGRGRTVERNSQNLATSTIDGRGNVTSYTYDGRGNLLTIADSVILAGSTGEVAGTILQAGETDTYTFEGTAGQIVRYDSLDNDLDGLPTQLFAPGGISLFSGFAFSGTQHDFDRPSVTLPQSGTYRLRIGGDRFTGDYRFRLIDVSARPTVAIGQTVTGSLDTDLEADVYRIVAAAGEHARFTNLVTSGTGPVWTVRSSELGSFGFSVSGSLDAPLDVSFPADGVYELVIDRSPSSATGARFDYQFTRSTVSEPARSLVGFGVTHSGTIAAGQTIDLPYSAPAGSLLYFDSLETATKSGVRGEWLDSAGAVLRSVSPMSRDVVGNFDRARFVAPKGDDYVFRVTNNGSTSSVYSFRWLDASTAAQPLTLDTPVTGQRSPGTEADWYSFAASYGERFYVDALAEGVVSSLLISPTGANSFFDAATVVRANRTGTNYVLSSDSFASAAPVSYGFQLKSVAAATSLPLDTTVNGALSGFADQVYRFSAAADQRIYVDSLGASSQGAWSLFGPNDALIGGFSSLTDDGQFTLPLAGEYVLALVSTTNSSVNYSFRIRTPESTTTPLTLGAAVAGTNVEAGEVHRYTFAAGAGRRVYLDSLVQPSSFFERVATSLVAPDGVTVGKFQSIADDELGPITVGAAGEYALQFGGTGFVGEDGQSGAHDFRLLDVAAAPAVTLGTPLSGTLNPGRSTQLYRLSGTAGQRLKFDGAGTAGAGRWRLFDPADTAVGAGVALDTDFFATLPIDGEYVLAVAGDRTAPINYQFTVTDASDPTAPPSGFGDTHSGSVAAFGSMTFPYVGSAGHLLYYDTFDGSSSLTLSLVAPDAQSLISGVGASFDSGVLVAPRTGDYTLRLQNQTSSASTYGFRLLDLSLNATALTLGTPVNDRIDPGRRLDVFSFDATAGDLLYFDDLAEQFSSLTFRLVAPNGAVTTVSSFSPTVRATQTGAYYLLVSASGTARDYSFQLSRWNDLAALIPPTNLVGSIVGYESHPYRFHGDAGQILFVQGQFSVGVKLFDSQGREIPAALRTAISLPRTDDYYFVLDGRNVPFSYNLPLTLAIPTTQTLSDSTNSAQPVTFTYEAGFNRLTSVTDELGHRTVFDIDAADGDLRSATRVVGTLGGGDDVVTSYVYLVNGLLDTVTDPLGHVTDFDYDALGRLTAVTQADGTADAGTTHFEYDAAGRQTAMIDARGNRTEWEYDAQNRVTRVREADPDGVGPLAPPVTEFDYDLAGNLRTVRDALGRVTTYVYDERDRLVSSTDALGGVTRFVVDPRGLTSAIVDPLGQRSTIVYDARGRVVRQVDPTGAAVSFAYDADDRLTSLVDAGGNRTTFAYDSRGRLTRRTDPLGAATNHAYDAANRLVQTVDRLGRERAFAYDSLDRLTSETWVGGGNTVTYGYDAKGRVIDVADAFSALTYVYDARDRVTSVDNLGTPAAPRVTMAYAYDVAGNLLERTDAIEGAAAGTETWTYDALNRPVRVVQSGPTVTAKRVDLHYDALGQFTSLSRFGDAAGTQLVARSLYSYDALDRLVGLRHQNASASDLAFYELQYDAASRITRSTDAGGATNYSYDARDQLTGVDVVGASRPDESYAYDANGNRTSSSTGGSYGIGANNRLTSDGTYDYQYDAEGNLTRRTNRTTGAYREFAWDHRNRLITVTDKTSAGAATQRVAYQYDAWNRRIAETVDVTPLDAVDGVRSHFLYDGADVAYDFTDADGAGPAAPQRAMRYLHGPLVDQVWAQENASGQVTWLLGDQLGTIRDLVDASGVVVNRRTYDSYGNLVSQTDATQRSRYGFTGREHDAATGLDYLRARYYAPGTGRFVSEDPLGFAGGDANLSAYVGNDPVNWRDPNGTDPQGIHRIGHADALGRRTNTDRQADQSVLGARQREAGLYGAMARSVYLQDWLISNKADADRMKQLQKQIDEELKRKNWFCPDQSKIDRWKLEQEALRRRIAERNQQGQRLFGSGDLGALTQEAIKEVDALYED